MNDLSVQIAEQLVRNLEATGDALLYTELDYLTFKEMLRARDNQLVSFSPEEKHFKVYFGEASYRQMTRRWAHEHCSQCGVGLPEDRCGTDYCEGCV